ncbi:MAG: hypothetical protein AAGA29_12470 [Planctomycetota bacterium]
MDNDKRKIEAFESRLRSVNPAEPSQVLRDRLASQLGPEDAGHDEAGRQRYGAWLIRAGGLAAAACVAFAVWLALSGPAGTPQSRVVDDREPAPGDVRPEPGTAIDTPEPVAPPAGSWLAYHYALRHSPDAALTALEPPTLINAKAAPGNTRPLRAMDVTMFLHEDERCDG